MSSWSVMLAGLCLMPWETWQWPSPGDVALLSLAGLFLIGGYVFIIIAMRTGSVGAVSPFRYTVILFALAAGYGIWGEVPDPISVAGIVVIAAAGLYTFHRQGVHGRWHSRTTRIVNP
jgi:drug/metabolite transporter (DMT)-like permease